MYQFPKDLYADVRIEEKYKVWLGMSNGEINADSAYTEMGAMIRVFDGKVWYTGSTNQLEEIQAELDKLAALATPNPNILEHPIVKAFQAQKVKALKYEQAGNVREISREEWKEILDGYRMRCVEESTLNIEVWGIRTEGEYVKECFYSSKGAEIIQDKQNCKLEVGYVFSIDGVPTEYRKEYNKLYKEELLGHEEAITLGSVLKYTFDKEAVTIEPGKYTCVLSPYATAMLVHESFGHRSESDHMLNDKTLQQTWKLGKKVASELVSICDTGNMLHLGYTPYDAEGTCAAETWLIKDGVLTGRLHDANSAAALGEVLTGNARAQDYHYAPIVRMTNTYMAEGKYDPKKMIEEVKDGLYIYNAASGTGLADFTMNPIVACRIRDGKLSEPVRINAMIGNVFETLFDIDAVGTDFRMVDDGMCGKYGQMVRVSSGGPSIRIKNLMVC